MIDLNLHSIISFVFDCPTVIIITYTGPPVILFSLSHQTPKESSVHCTVNGGKPSSYLHNIMLIKNESTVIQAQGDHLSYNISLDMFGVYTCIVESLHSTDNKTLLIPEKGKQKFCLSRLHKQC